MLRLVKREARVRDELFGVRTVKNELQTAVNVFTHPDGRTVTIVGIEHLGTPEYFAQLRKVVDELEAAGASVRLETFQGQDNADAARDQAELEALRRLHDSIASRFNAWSELGLSWIGQRDSVMSTAPSWTHSDVADIDLVRVLGPEYHPASGKELQSKIEWIRQRNATYGLALLRYLEGWKQVRRGDDVQKDKHHVDWWAKQVISSWRECVELTKVLGQEGDTVLIWGAPHMKGLSQGLLRNGFELVDTQWFTACTAPRLWWRPSTRGQK
ncbi:hypothetical protein [Actinophytocola xanthii]|uniref:Uncharacterized protein n=1 Tax=Actinophytocola xanthii TaxID=1912961 RepID=A0A1Q8BTW0_9PSEU|nr:hypothetical protein [Actinophytocola xanthii]OLF05546.1 hypothetical protein BU204_37035 [Actinophytocola xanthii]